MQSRLFVSHQHQNENEWREEVIIHSLEGNKTSDIIYRKHHELFGKIHVISVANNEQARGVVFVVMKN